VHRTRRKNSWAGFVAIKMSEATIQFPSVDFDKELREYKSRLLGPATNVNASHYTETGGLTLTKLETGDQENTTSQQER